MNSLCENCCGSEWTALYSVTDFDTGTKVYWLGKCENCQIIATMDVSNDTLSRAYSRQYYGSGNAKFPDFLERWLTAGSRRNANAILDQWRMENGQRKTPKVLDIGCGRGTLLREFQTLGADILGLERPEFPLGEASAQFIRVGSIMDEQFNGCNFDIVIFWHVLEHMAEVEDMLKTVSGHLNENALLIIAVPNFGSYQQRLFTRHWFHLDIPRHLNHFDKNWLVTCLNRNGFGEFSISTFDLTQNIYGFVQSALNLLFPGRPNAMYRLLKHQTGNRNWIELLTWVCLALPLLPIAVIESAFSALTGQGATLTLYARNRTKKDNR